MKFLLIILTYLSSICFIYGQADSSLVVGVSPFTSEVNTPFTNSVSEKVVQIVTNIKRFKVVDRTSYDKVKLELEFQKNEAFIESKNLVKQDAALAANHLIIGHIVKMNIYTIKNSDGTVNGYKASAAFTLKINNVESGMTTEAESFQTEVSPLSLSKEQAINQALKSIDIPISQYFVKQFPIVTRVLKILDSKKEYALKVLINGGFQSGLMEYDKFDIESIEILEGKPYPTKVGEAKLTKVVNADFSECLITKGGKELMDLFNQKHPLRFRQVFD